VEEIQWEAERQLRGLSSAASDRLHEVALRLIAQGPPAEQRFPAELLVIRDRVDAIPLEKLMVEISVVEDESLIRRDSFHLWITADDDGSLRLELTSGKQPGYEFDHILNLRADGEVFDQSGEAEVDMEEIRAEEEAARRAVEGS
jgi:hypothetical protein